MLDDIQAEPWRVAIERDHIILSCTC